MKVILTIIRHNG